MRRQLLLPIIVGLLLITGLVGLLHAKLYGDMETKQSIIIDTDMGSDDWLAILYLLKHANVDIRGFILDGNGTAHLSAAKDNLLRLLTLVNYNKPLIVGEGREYNLIGDKSFPKEFRESVDKPLKLPIKNKNNIRFMSARAAYKNILEQAKHPITILATGPLSTLANALQQKPKLKQKIQRIVILGGAINAPGNVAEFVPELKNNVAEWNFYVDPLAAQMVLQSGVPITLVPLDVTNQVSLDKSILPKLYARPRTPSIHFMITLLENDYFTDDNEANYYFWDPLTAGVLIHPEIVSTQPMSLAVETKSPQLWGKVSQKPYGHKVDVALAVAADTFINDFIATLAKNPNNTDN